MRTVIAALIGGVIFFVWGALSHMVLQIGDVGVHYATPPAGVMTALKEQNAASGIHVMPSLPREKMQDSAAMAAFAQNEAKGPYAFVVYAPGGNPSLQNMGPVLGHQWLTDTLCALILAFVLAAGGFSFGRSVLVAAAFGAFAWLAIQMPMSWWYFFPLDYSMGIGIKQVVGWVLAGSAMAWWLGRGRKAA